MEERHSQVRVGAGRDEARLNQEFIDFLRRASGPALIGLAVITGGYWAWHLRAEARRDALVAAFVQLDAAELAGNPVGLIAVANDHRGQGAVPMIAELAAADIYLGSFRAGLREGANISPTGEPEDPATVLTEEERLQQLEKAAQLYQKVFNDTTGNLDYAQHTIGAMYGLAAVAESKSDFDGARRQYEAISSLARTAEINELADLAKHRLDTLGALAGVPKLISKAQLPAPPAPPDGPIYVPPELSPFREIAQPEGSAPAETAPAPAPSGAKPLPEKPATPPSDPPKEEPGN